MTRKASNPPIETTENKSGDSIGAWVETWLQATKRKGRSADHTLPRYRREFQQYIAWLEQNERPSTPKELSGVAGGRHLEDFLDALRGEGKATGTLRLYHQTFRTFFKWCIKQSASDDPNETLPPHVLRSPTDFVDAPPDTPAPDVGEKYTEAEYKRMLAAAGDPRTSNVWRRRNRVLIRLLYSTGMRRGEIAGLEIADYNANHTMEDGSTLSTITIRDDNAKRTKRGRDARIVGVFNSVKEEIDLYIRILRDHGHTTGALFPSERRDKSGNLISLAPHGVNHIVRSLARKLQENCPNKADHGDLPGCADCIRWADVHRWRHTWAINALLRRIPPLDVMKAGGWANISMLDRYIHTAGQEISLRGFEAAENGQH